MADFGFSDRGNGFHNEINSRLPKLEELLDRLLADRSPRLLHLRKLIASDAGNLSGWKVPG